MTSTVFTIDDLLKQPDHGVPFTERRDSFELYEIPYYREALGVAPAGAIDSNLEDMSKWLVALMNDGKSGGRAVNPAGVLKATLAPAIALPNTQLESRGWGELLNPVYGMGRFTASYRGHLLTYHGGDINGFHSQVSSMPNDGYGVIVLVIGDHCAPLYNVVSYNVYERLLGLDPTPWSERDLAIRLKGKEAEKQTRGRAGGERVAGTKPAHALEEYVGEYINPAYGVLTIASRDGGLQFDFHGIRLPLTHFHYERFDTPDDEQDGSGRWASPPTRRGRSTGRWCRSTRPRSSSPGAFRPSCRPRRPCGRMSARTRPRPGRDSRQSSGRTARSASSSPASPSRR